MFVQGMYYAKFGRLITSQQKANVVIRASLVCVVRHATYLVSCLKVAR